MLTVALAQIPVTFDVSANLDVLLDVLQSVESGDIVVTPEGALTGYLVGGASDAARLESAEPQLIAEAIERVAAESIKRGVVVWLGVCRKLEGHWVNEALGLFPDGSREEYRKVNLATAERHLGFSAGESLPTYPSGFDDSRVAIQLCRELRFPEQWRALADAGASILLHLNHGVGMSSFTTWRAMLVSRAAENQRYVVSVNAASPDQHCPSIAVAPDGSVLEELDPGEHTVRRIDVDPTRVSDWYLRQRRLDLTPQLVDPVPAGSSRGASQA